MGNRRMGLGRMEALLEQVDRELNLVDSTLLNCTITTSATATFTGNVSALARNTGDIAVSGTTYGVGAIGTGAIGAPELYRYTENGVIVTQIKVDITGLSCKGDAAEDVIGLAAGGAAYIYRNVVADNGILYRMEVACIELPGQGTATITTDIDFAFNSSATLAFDGAAGTAEMNMGTSVAGTVVVDNVLGLTANDYLYIVEGDTAATTGIYNAGQYLITLYGHALLT
jgi:hypothetical protein